MFWFFFACIDTSVLFEKETISWETADIDQDGWTIADGDCWEAQILPPQIEGARRHFLSSADIHPEAEEYFYDGIDANCDGLDDFDQDGDGFVPTEYAGIETFNLEGSGELPAGDCWDGGAEIPQDFWSINNFTQLLPEEVYPEAEDRAYDGVNQDCGEDLFEFDQDRDGDESQYYADRFGMIGGDCFDYVDDLDPEEVGAFEPSEINSNQEERFYDGVDQNCDGLDDFDQDGDGFSASEYGGLDCDDLDAEISIGAEEHINDGIDQDCDGFELCYIDTDGDGYGSELLGLSDVFSCLGEGFSAVNADCDDSDGSVYPWADEIMTAEDKNCDGLELQGYEYCDGRWYGGKYFLSCQGSVSYAEANALCLAHGYDGLTQITSEQENTIILQGIVSVQRFWIGLSDQVSEGVYRWQNQTGTISYFNWAFGQPDNSNNQDCVSISIFGWYDDDCAETRGFVCQIR